MNNRILWMHDLSAGADACEGAVRAVARWMDGEVRLVHATGAPLQDPEVGFDPTSDARQELARMRLEPVVAHLLNAGFAADLVIAVGQPVDLAQDLLREDRGALVVVGASDVVGLDRVLLGSTAARLVRHLPCSVLVVRRDLSRATRVMCALDPEDPSEPAILLATALAHRAGAALDYIAVVPAVLDFAETEPVEERLAARVEALTGEGLRAGWAVRSVVADTPVLGILHVVGNYDLLVVGSHNRKGLKRILLGSVSETVVAKSPVCVLVAR